jgi:hypothetical protein
MRAADLGPTQRALRRTSASSWYMGQWHLKSNHVDLDCLNYWHIDDQILDSNESRPAVVALNSQYYHG